MSRFLKNVVLFGVVVVVAYPFLIFLSGYLPIPKAFVPNINYWVDSSMVLRVNEAKQSTGNVDILFLGSSLAYRGFDPRNFQDKKCFNLGSSVQTPIQTKLLLERYLDRLNPKLVVYEVYPGGFSADGVESSLDIISNDKNDLGSIKMALSLRNIKPFNTLIFATFVNQFDLHKNFNQPMSDRETYIPGGFVESEVAHHKFVNYRKSEWTFRQDQIDAFEECLRIFKHKNIKTVLVLAPITKRLYESYTNNDYVDSTLKAYKLEYYNFNNIMQLNDSLHHYDTHHLNQNGVNLFNKKLSEVLNL